LELVVNVTQTPSLTSQAVMLLRNDIVRVNFAADERLNIESLKCRYEMGGTPVREALNQLVGERFVVALALKGFRVAGQSIELCRDLIRARYLLELDLFKQAMLFGDDAWEARCVGEHFRFMKCENSILASNSSSVDAWFGCHHDFFNALVSGANSYWLSGLYTNLLQHVERYCYRVYCCKGFSEMLLLSAADYKDVVASLVARDQAALEKSVAGLMEQVLHKINGIWLEVLAVEK